jgi:hypothetical protein
MPEEVSLGSKLQYETTPVRDKYWCRVKITSRSLVYFSCDFQYMHVGTNQSPSGGYHEYKLYKRVDSIKGEGRQKESMQVK